MTNYIEHIVTALRKAMHHCVVFLAVMALCVQLSSPAEASGYSAAQTTMPQVGQINVICPTTLLVQNPLRFYLFSLIIPCLQKMVVNATEKLVTAFYPWVSSAITAAVTLAVIIFGILMMTQAVERLQRDSFVFAVKVVVVIMITQNMMPLLTMFYDIQNGLIEIVTGFSGFFTGLKCPVLPSNLFGIYSVWFRADCILNIIIGLGAPKTLANGLLAFFASSLFTGGLMVGVALVGFYMCFNIIMGLLTATRVYLACVLGLGLMIIVGGIFIPLMLFKNTMNYYKKWGKTVVGLTVQPMVVFAFLNIMISAFDNAIYSGDFSVLRTLAGNSVDAVGLSGSNITNIQFGFNLNKYMEDKKLYNPEKKGLTIDLSPETFRSGIQSRQTGQTGKIVTPDPADAERASKEAGRDSRDFRFGMQFNTINTAEMAKVRVPKVQASGVSGSNEEADFLMEVLGSFALAWLVSFIFSASMAMIPEMTNKLTGVSLDLR